MTRSAIAIRLLLSCRWRRGNGSVMWSVRLLKMRQSPGVAFRYRNCIRAALGPKNDCTGWRSKYDTWRFLMNEPLGATTHLSGVSVANSSGVSA
eukprot:6498392-Prymnesium_polylepis.1